MVFTRVLYGLPRQEKIDLDADAAAILNGATKAVKVILDRRAELDRQGMSDVPLTVIVGERHSVPAHRIFQMSVLKALKEHERTAVSLEAPHNLAMIEYKKIAGEEPDATAKAHIRKQDRNGQVSLQSAIAESDDHTRTTFFSFLDKNRIPVRFTDAAITQGSQIDCDDPSTADSLPAQFNKAARHLAFELEAVDVRNRHMAKVAAAHAREQHARILFHVCGGAHVAGDSQLEFPGSQSLSSYFKAQALPVLAIPLAFKDLGAETWPQDAPLEKSEIHVAVGLPQSEAREPSPFEILNDEPFPAFLDQDEEADYMNAMLRRTGLRDYQLEIREFDEEKRSAFGALARLFLNPG